MNEITDTIMHGRKRCFSSNKKILEPCPDFLSINELGERQNSAEYLFHKFAKIEPQGFASTYFSPPGDCTRSKTIKGLEINPFDLSRPESDDTYTRGLTCSTPLISNASSKYRLKSQGSWQSELSFDSACDVESVSESILSFASKSPGEDSFDSQDLSLSSWSEESEILSTKLKQKSSPMQNCSDSGFLLPISMDSSSNNVLIPQISSHTLANLLSGNHTLSNNIAIYDCRFPYEYSGGRVINATNAYTSQKLLQSLFPVKSKDTLRNFEDDISKMATKPKRKLKKDDTIYIFYCEFSSYRGPKLAQCLRGLDRLANSGSRDLYFPHIYVLHKGYSDFFAEYPQFCCPNGYVSMKKNPYSLRNSIGQSPKFTKNTNPKSHRNEHLRYEKDMRESENNLRDIITKRTTDSDILQLFSAHATVGAI